MKKVEAVIRPEKLDSVRGALASEGYTGFMVLDVRGHGSERTATGEYRGTPFTLSVTHKLLLEMVVDDEEVAEVVEILVRAARTGQVGDGLVLVTEVASVYQIRSGLTNSDAVHT